MIEDGKLYGRGAVDMKGGIAASIMAFKLLAEFVTVGPVKSC